MENEFLKSEESDDSFLGLDQMFPTTTTKGYREGILMLTLSMENQEAESCWRKYSLGACLSPWYFKGPAGPQEISPLLCHSLHPSDTLSAFPKGQNNGDSRSWTGNPEVQSQSKVLLSAIWSPRQKTRSLLCSYSYIDCAHITTLAQNHRWSCPLATLSRNMPSSADIDSES